MTSARDITRAAWPPRSVYLDYPLGHTSGKPHEPELNLQILRDTFAAFEHLGVPGSMAHLPYRWSETDRWKDKVFAPSTKAADLPECATPGGDGAQQDATGGDYEDDRVERHPTPQHQTEDDAAAARLSHDGEDCLVCAGIDY
ncbi:hypothetical protein [Candidatus Poriferisodalis sp.]|uniref:hypothetical protein n=1 Tax=Candidatus Poriferisodalis sp. TaxID=3101277 RepID=UPI003B021364